MVDSIDNKEAIYGKYEGQVEAVARIVETLDNLRSAVSAAGMGLNPEEKVDYTILALKLTRSVTAKGESSVDSWLDLANYSRLVCRRRTGIDIAGDFGAIARAAEARTERAASVPTR